MSIICKTKTITPERAMELLERTSAAGVLNRKPSMRTVDRYAIEMKNGHWKLNSESVKLDENGYVLDGQHRLMACIKSGKSFQTILMKGVPRDTFDTIDCGRNRTGTQVLQMSGVQYHTVITGIINGLSEFRSYGHMACKEKRMSPSAVLAEYNEHADEYDYASRFAMKCVGESHAMTSKLVGTLFYYLAYDLGVSKTKVEKFFASITSFDTADNATLEKMRRWNLANKDRRVSEKLKIAYIIRTWNAYVTGARTPRFTDHDDEPMPTFIK